MLNDLDAASAFLEQLAHHMKYVGLMAVIALKAKPDNADGIDSISRP
jgi:hypothetical protein